MNSESRSYNSILNAFFGIGGQLLSVAMSFIVRYVFIRALAAEYLGVNGLFTSILSVLSLAELGIGTAIVYSLYKPIAEKDEPKICVLMNLYAKVYITIGVVIAVLGVAITPFLGYLIKDTPDIPGITLIYLIYLLDTFSSYFFAYKRSLLSADQREHVLSVNRLIFMIFKSAGQIAVLLLFHNFYLYLFIQILCTFLENVRVSCLVDKYYPFLKKNTHKEKLPADEIKKIVSNVKALFIYKASAVFLGGIDNLIISSQIGVLCVAMYSNYLLVVNSITNLINIFVNSFTASIGNFLTTKKSEDQTKLFDRVVFVVFLLVGFASVCLFVLLNPFIRLYSGKDLMLSDTTVLFIVINFFIVGMMTPIWNFRTTMGLFVHGRWRPVISAGINLVLSFLLVQWFGIEGVLFATIVSRATTNLWFDPYIIYKKGWNLAPYSYYLRFMMYTLYTFAVAYALAFACNLMGFAETWPGFILQLIVTSFISLAAFGLPIVISADRNYYFDLLKRVIDRFLHRKTV